MKEYFKLIFLNTIFLIPAISGLYFNNYHFFIKSFYLIFIIVITLGCLTIIGNDESFKIYIVKYKKRNLFYKISSRLFDILFLIMFSLLDYRLIFIFYIIQEIFILAMHNKADRHFENLNKKEEII